MEYTQSEQFNKKQQSKLLYGVNDNKKDAELIVGSVQGNEKNFEILVKRYLKGVYNFVYRMIGDTSDAEDIAQETFIKVWKNIKKYNPEKSFKTWLFSIARNTVIDYLRKRKNLPFSNFEDTEGNNFLTENLTDPEPLPDELLARAENKEFLDNALKQLSIIYKEVLILHYQEHLTFEEIGQVLKKPSNTVKSQHRRGLIELRKILQITHQ